MDGSFINFQEFWVGDDLKEALIRHWVSKKEIKVLYTLTSVLRRLDSLRLSLSSPSSSTLVPSYSIVEKNRYNQISKRGTWYIKARQLRQLFAPV